MFKTDKEAVVKVEFDSIPSLPMIVEAAAQASAAFGDENVNLGFLVTLKNVKLLQTPESLQYDVKIINEHNMGAMTYYSFEFLEEDVLIATGSFVIAVE
jgi:hypothetical protein